VGKLEPAPSTDPIDALPTERQDPGIELLVTLAKSGEIDPWHIDIIVVTDKYLAALDRMETRNLQACGKGLFYACVLLHLKAQILAATYRPPEPPPPEDDFGDIGMDDGFDTDAEWADVVSSGNGVLLVPRGRPRQRPITLDDLIRALQRCDTAERTRRDQGLPPTSFFVDSTIQDDVAADIDLVRGLLARVMDVDSGPTPFRKLLGSSLSASGVFLALLFMAARNEVELAQQNFYQDLSVLRGEG
jgi:segregation and condensation protein A